MTQREISDPSKEGDSSVRWDRWFRTPPPEYADKRLESAPPLLKTAKGEPVSTRQTWQRNRGGLLRKWRGFLGEPPFPPPKPEARIEREEEQTDYSGTLLKLRVEPNRWERAYLMKPKGRGNGPFPAMVVFYYDVDTPVGRDLGGYSFTPEENRHIAQHLVQRGYAVLTMRNYIVSWSNKPKSRDRWMESARRLRRRYPNWTGMGKMTWDASRCVDYLETLPWVDRERIGCIGHSLGGKITLYAMAFDRRFRAGISSEPGIGISFSNWQDPWYLGPIDQTRFGHHQLLALVAPRPFLLIGGDASDGDESWLYINTAMEVYRLYVRERHLGYINHRQGHGPPMDVLRLAYDWLDEVMRNIS